MSDASQRNGAAGSGHAGLPSADEIVAFASASGTNLPSPTARSLRQLHARAVVLAPAAPLADRLAQLEGLGSWVLGGGRVDGCVQAQADEAPATARLRVLLAVLEAFPALGSAFAAVWTGVIAESSGATLFEIGVPNDRGIAHESSDRVARALLPVPRDERELAGLVERLFPGPAEVAWLGAVPIDLVARVVALVGADAFGPLRQAVHDAASLGALRIAALGLSADIRKRSPPVPLRESPFFVLPDVVAAAFAARGQPELGPALGQARTTMAACADACASVMSHLDEHGVSTDVVYRIEVIGRRLERLRALLTVLAPGSRKIGGVARGTALLHGLAQSRLRDRSLRDLARTNLRLLARKIAERAGHSGEHYITASAREWRQMLLSASGGGVLTTFTAALKVLISSAHLPLFVEGVASSVNYAASFLLMQLFGLTLATKQPSMTAAALAGALKQERHTATRPVVDGDDEAESDRDTRTEAAPAPQSLDQLVTLIARITRSQLAAAIGNIGAVIPSVLLFDVLHRQSTGRAFLNPTKALATVESLHPLESGTLAFAALTGVFLWMSSLGAGWFENWAVYRRVPQAIAEHRLGAVFGAHFMHRLGAALGRGIAGIGGNVSLGFLLGMTPVFGTFLGLPIEVRHVTLSTGSLAFATSALGTDAAIAAGMPAALLGVACIGILNFGVSFILALALALRAREVQGGLRRLAQAVLVRLVRSPREFFVPRNG